MWTLAAAALLVAALAWAQPSRVGCGPTQAGCGPAVVTGSGPTTTTTLPATVTIPATVGADLNCAASTPPVINGTLASWLNYVSYTQTCLTGANAAGYSVTAISVYIGAATAGQKVKCSVYDAAAPKNHVAAGCDTVEATLAANPSAYVTMATTGACPLAASIRYWIACATTDGVTAFGQVTSPTCASCWMYNGSVAYAGLWPATLPSNGFYNATQAAYLTATANP